MAGFDWGSLIGAALTYLGSKQANKGNNASIASQQAGIDEMKREFDLSRSDQLPWLTAGTGALGQLGKLNSGDMTAFHQSPDFQFGLDTLTKQDDRSAASRGRLDSGGYGLDYAKDVMGYANNEYNTYYNRIANLAGVGQTAAQNLGNAGQTYANNVAGQYNNIGNLRNSSYNNNANMYAGLGGLFNNWYQQHRATSGGSNGYASGYSPYGGDTYSMNNNGPG